MNHSEIHTIDDNTVRKILKSNLPIYKKRFLQEIDILKMLSNIPNVVEFKVSGICENNMPYYDMPKYAGNSTKQLKKTKGDVLYVVNLLLPIIKTLKTLSEMDFPIYHKDLKPENLLVKNDNELVLADFGCAIMHDDGKGRITSNMRMVGERSFLAPEYATGQAEELSEKADIFSIGKLLWYFVNGDEKEVFPGALWSCEDFDIIKRFPRTDKISKIQSIIGWACSPSPKKRIGYAQLIDELEKVSDLTW